MSDLAIRFEEVSKRFALGERFTSLRDLLPALARRALGRRGEEARKGDFWALRDINLQVRKGEALGIVGHNGAGKSTLLKHLAGIMVPTKGSIEVDGRISALIEVGAGFHPELTGRENVFLSGVILGMSRTEVARKFDEIVDFSELETFIDTPVKRYSSGMFARLGFSVAAHLDPDILIIDEVLSVGDFSFQAKSLQKMRSIAASGATVLFVSHDLKAVSDLCPRAVLLESGAVTGDGPTSRILERYLERERAKLEEQRGGPVRIRSVSMRNAAGHTERYRPGEKVWIDVVFKANDDCKGVAVVLQVLDDHLGDAFNTSSERLGHEPVDLSRGQSCRMTFELDLHLTKGTFHVAVYLHRYDIDRGYDRVYPAATFFMESDVDVRGGANLYPRIVAAPIGQG